MTERRLLRLGSLAGWFASTRRALTVVIVAGLLLTATMFVFARSATNQALGHRADQVAEQARATLTHRIDTYVEVVSGLRSAFYTSDPPGALSRVGFHRYVESGDVLRRAPGVRALSFDRVVPASGVEEFTRRVREDRSVDPAGYADYQVHPLPPAGSSVVAVDYLEPVVGNDDVFGLDIASEPVRRDALFEARDTGDPVASSPIKLVQGGLGSPGVLIMLAVYDQASPPVTAPARRRAFVGVIVAVVDAREMLAGVLTSPDIAVSIHDVGRVVEETPRGVSVGGLVFATDPERANGGSLQRFRDLNVGDRRWRVTVAAGPGFTTAADRAVPAGVLAAGSTTTALALLLVLSLIRSRDLAATAASEDRFRKLAGTASDAIVSADEGGRIMYVNAAAVRLFGYAGDDEFVGQPLTMLMPERYRDAHSAGWERFQETGIPTAIGKLVVVDGIRRDGSEFPLELSLSVWGISTQRFFTGFLRDITEKKELEVAREREAARARLSADVVQAVAAAPDLQTAFMAFGERVRKLIPFDRTSFAVREANTEEFVVAGVWGPDGWRIPEGARVAVNGERLWSAYRAGHALLVDDTGAPDASPVDRELLRMGIRSYVTVPVVAAGDVRALVNFSSTRTGAFEADSTQVAESLVRETASTFNTLLLLGREREAIVRLRQLDELKNEFVGVVAHDLRSPMTVIGGFAQVLRDQWENLPDGRRERLLDRISANIDRLSDLVGDVLDVARLESGVMEYDTHPFDVSSLVRRTVAEVATTAPDRQCTAEILQGSAMGVGDETRYWQVITNLVTNAIKFSPTGAPVRVNVTRTGDDIRIAVTDEGSGISSDDMPRLFEKFSRLPIRDGGPKPPGTGLGLYICRTIVEDQQGRLWVESTLGEGSTFSFTIPALMSSA